MLTQILPGPGEVVVAETGDGKFAQVVRVGRHELVADEPVASGGDDLGPGPYDYLMAALGACTAMTIRLVSSRRGLPLTRVAVRLSHSRGHGRDVAECEDRPARLDRIKVDVILEGPLDQTQRDYLMGVAEKCPVHRTLAAGIDLSTGLSAPLSTPARHDAESARARGNT